MSYRVELAATAKADFRGQARWLRENVSPAAATKWLDGLYKAIECLLNNPGWCIPTVLNYTHDYSVRIAISWPPEASAAHQG